MCYSNGAPSISDQVDTLLRAAQPQIQSALVALKSYTPTSRQDCSELQAQQALQYLRNALSELQEAQAVLHRHLPPWTSEEYP